MELGNKNSAAGKGGKIVVVVLILTALAFTTLWYRESTTGPLHTAKKVVSVVTAPLSKAGSVLFTPVRALRNWGSGVSVSREEADTLKKQNIELRAQVMQLEESRKEVQRLTKLLSIQDVLTQKTVGARIISNSSDSWSNAIVIDKGSKEGIEEGMPVMGALSPQSKVSQAGGVIGRVVQVTPYSSTVLLLSDPNSGVGAMIQSNRAEGLVVGSASQGLLLKNIKKEYTVKPGDVVITSGAGGVFPKGLIVGEVSIVGKNPNDVFQSLVVKPASDPSRIEEVLIIVGEDKSKVGN